MERSEVRREPVLDLDAGRRMSYNQAVVRGAGLTMEHCLHDWDAYRELLEEELEGRPAARRYLEQCAALGARLRALVEAVSAGVVYEDTQERLGLRGVVSGVVSRYQRIMPDGRGIAMDVEEDLFIRGDVYQLQEMFYRYLDDAFEERRPWFVVGRHVALSQVEMKQLGSKLPAGDYAMLSIAHDRTMDRIPAGFLDVSENWGGDAPDGRRLLRLLYWCGVARGYGGCVLQGRGRDSGIVLLLPLAEGWTEAPDDQLEFKDNDGRKTILLVDDEDMIWDVINDMLQDMGYQVILAGNGLEAVEIYENNPGAIDLVLLDMIMPEMSGKEAFARLKQIDPEVRVLLSSGYVSGEEVADVLNAGAKGFLKKPYRMADLARRIKEII